MIINEKSNLDTLQFVTDSINPIVVKIIAPHEHKRYPVSTTPISSKTDSKDSNQTITQWLDTNHEEWNSNLIDPGFRGHTIAVNRGEGVLGFFWFAKDIK